MADFWTLQTRVQRRVIDLPASVISEVPDLINEAIRDLQDSHNFHVMGTVVEATTVAATRALLATPADFKQLRGRAFYTSFTSGGITEITAAPNRNAAQKAFGTTTTGSPAALLISEENDQGVANIELFPLSDSTSDYGDDEYRITVPYWRYMTALSANGDTNWFTVNAIPFILDVATAKAFELNWDEERAGQWADRAERSRAVVIDLDKRFLLGSVTTLIPFRGAREAKIERN